MQESSNSDSMELCTIGISQAHATRNIAVYPGAPASPSCMKPVSIELEAQPTHLDKSLNALAWNCLIGDALHNLVDGLLIGTTLSTAGPVRGALVTAIIVVHELPQEVAELCILLQAGW